MKKKLTPIVFLAVWSARARVNSRKGKYGYIPPIIGVYLTKQAAMACLRSGLYMKPTGNIRGI